MHYNERTQGGDMKKKTLKKLELSKETLRNLTNKDLTAVHGGDWTFFTCDPEGICYNHVLSEMNC
jgi:hypothetical protein